MFRKILVALDGSAGSRRALMAAMDLGKKYDARVHLLSVEEHLPAYAATVGEVEEARQEQNIYFAKVQEEAGEVARAYGLEIEGVIRAGHAAETIIRYANEGGFDLIVMGTHGRTGLQHVLLGSVAEKVVRLAPCPVLTVRHNGNGSEA